MCARRQKHATQRTCAAETARPSVLALLLLLRGCMRIALCNQTNRAFCAPPGPQPGVKVVSASYGGASDSPSGRDYIKALQDKGILFVAAAGEGSARLHAFGRLLVVQGTGMLEGWLNFTPWVCSLCSTLLLTCAPCRQRGPECQHCAVLPCGIQQLV